MKLRRLIFTTTKNFKWQSSFNAIATTQRLTQGLEPDHTEVLYVPLKSMVTRKDKDGDVKPDWAWFKTTFTTKAKGYTTVCLHLSERDRKRFKLSKHVNGSYQDDPDDVFEYYVIANTQKEFERLILHEEGHGVERFTLGHFVEWVHYYDYIRKDLSAFYKHMDFTTHNALKAERDSLVIRLGQLLSMKKTFIQTCNAALGTDVTPDDLVPDTVACAITVSTLIAKLDATFPKVAGTWTLYDILEHRKDWKRVADPTPGCVVLSPTGMGKKGTIGHVGIVMDDGRIASNNSKTGKFEKNYTLDSWTAYYGQKQGMPILIYKKK